MAKTQRTVAVRIRLGGLGIVLVCATLLALAYLLGDF